MTTGNPRVGSALTDARPIKFGPGRLWNDWKMYEYDYIGNSKTAPWGEVNTIENIQVGFHHSDCFISFLMQDEEALKRPRNEVLALDEPHLFLMLSTTNSAHSMSELLSFLHFLERNPSDLLIAVNSIIVERMPFLYGLLQRAVPTERIRVLDASRVYSVRAAWLRRNVHMNAIQDFEKVSFEQNNDLLYFRDLNWTQSAFEENPRPLMEQAKAAFARCSEPKPPIVMLVKSAEDLAVTSPERAMVISAPLRHRLARSGISLMSIGDFRDTDHYLSTLYGAKIFITSYGGSACTNRFFCSPDCRVLLLANVSYRPEYRFPYDAESSRLIGLANAYPGGDFWHLRSTHIFPVKEQIVVLDHNNTMTEADADRIISLSASWNH